MQLLVNAFGMFWAFYRGHFSHDFRAQDVTLKPKASATKCISDVFTVVAYLHTTDFKNRQGINYTKCTCFCLS